MNTVVLQGVVTDNQWKYRGDTLFTLHLVDADDYVNVRVRNFPAQVEARRSIVVKGHLTTRNERDTIFDFIARADGGDVDRKTKEKMHDKLGTASRTQVEVVAEEISVLQ